MLASQRAQIVALAARHGIGYWHLPHPAIESTSTI
jgi:hypothetical protein